MSLRQLAQMTGISKTHLNYIEKNEREPSFPMAIRIAYALNIKLEDLYRIVP
ncbi:MAG: helix-turn-helix transcriptional regulator [Clostridia bacterium]|nr:helix-turn-helix transcriptional regulator [Clostridia bacterium]